MTRPAEIVTFEFEGEEGVWAPVCELSFFPLEGQIATREQLIGWFERGTRPTRGLLKALRVTTAPVGLSTALNAPAVRYAVRDGLVYPQWAAFSVVDREKLESLEIPTGLTLEAAAEAVFLHFESPDPLELAKDLELARCTHGSDLHWYAGRAFAPAPVERVLRAPR